MRPTSRPCSIWIGNKPRVPGHVGHGKPRPKQVKTINHIKTWAPVPRSVGTVTPEEFQKYTTEDAPVIFKHSEAGIPPGSPVVQRWFVTKNDRGAKASEYLSGFDQTIVTYEWTLNRVVSSFVSSLNPGALQSTVSRHLLKAAAEPQRSFLRFRAPLGLFLAALDYNSRQAGRGDRVTGLYIAQSSISDLPPGLRDDLSPPPLVDVDGIYSSSIWMGITPTYTPLHRDPNPNLFWQLYGSKVVRIMPRRAAIRLFEHVQTYINGSASPRLRGEDMMSGDERGPLHDAVWTQEGHPQAAPGERTFYEARVDPGDALYIPAEWWHSFKSVGPDPESQAASVGELNCSANWWFRSSGVGRP